MTEKEKALDLDAINEIAHATGYDFLDIMHIVNELEKKDAEKNGNNGNTEAVDDKPQQKEPKKQKKEKPKRGKPLIDGEALHREDIKKLEAETPLLTKEPPWNNSRWMDMVLLESEEGNLRAIERGEAPPINYVGPWVRVDRKGDVKEFYHGDFVYRVVLKHTLSCKIQGMPCMWDGRRYIAGWEPFDRLVYHAYTNAKKSHCREVEALLDLRLEDHAEINAGYVQFNNGILDLDKYFAGDSDAFSTETRPDLYITNVLPWDFNPDSYSEMLDVMMDKLADYRPAIRMRIEEAMGAAIYRKALRRCVIAVGPGGNGKGTWTKLLNTMLGAENVSNVPIGKFDSFDSHSMMGKLVNIDADIASNFLDGKHLSVLRKVTGEDSLLFPIKNKDCITWDIPYVTLIMCANEMFTARSSDATTEGMLERLVFIPFTHKFKEDDDHDIHVIKKITSDHEAMEYALLLALRGLKRLIENQGDYTPCEEADKLLQDFKTENDSIAAWIEECGITRDWLVDWERRCNDNPFFRSRPVKRTTPPSEHYRNWCKGNNRTPLSANKFGRYLCKEFKLRRGKPTKADYYADCVSYRPYEYLPGTEPYDVEGGGDNDDR